MIFSMAAVPSWGWVEQVGLGTSLPERRGQPRQAAWRGAAVRSGGGFGESRSFEVSADLEPSEDLWGGWPLSHRASFGLGLGPGIGSSGSDGALGQPEPPAPRGSDGGFGLRIRWIFLDFAVGKPYIRLSTFLDGMGF